MNDYTHRILNNMVNEDKALQRGRAHGFWAMWLVLAAFALLSWVFAPDAEHTTFVNGQFVKCAELHGDMYMCEAVR